MLLGSTYIVIEYWDSKYYIDIHKLLQSDYENHIVATRLRSTCAFVVSTEFYVFNRENKLKVTCKKLLNSWRFIYAFPSSITHISLIELIVFSLES